MKELKYLNRYFLKHKYRLFIGILITVIARIFLVFSPKFLGDAIAIIEQYIKTNAHDLALLKEELLYHILLIIGVSLIGAFFTFLMRQTLIVMSRLIEFDLKNEVYQHYQKLSLSFYKQNIWVV